MFSNPMTLPERIQFHMGMGHTIEPQFMVTENNQVDDVTPYTITIRTTALCSCGEPFTAVDRHLIQPGGPK